MTTQLTDPGAAPGTPPGASRRLRRSSTDRMLTGVAGGLGDYFLVDPVIFRVLFAVLSFFGGAGLVLYLVCWALIPEPGVEKSALDRGVEQLRLRRIPPWVAIAGVVVVLWIGWFSWWAPGPALPALVVIALLLVVLVRRLGRRPATAPLPTPWAPTTGVDLDTDATEWAAPAPPPLARPVNDLTDSMRAWVGEAKAARRERLSRRRPVKVGALLGLLGAWTVVAILDAANRVAFPAYLWTGLVVLGVALVAGVVLRRAVWSLLVPIVVLLVVAAALGGTKASLRDGSGRTGTVATSSAQLTDRRQFAGQDTVDLTQLPAITEARTVQITQAVGEVIVRVPATANVLVSARVHAGDIELNSSHAAGDYVSGTGIALDLPPAVGITGPQLRISVDLTVGHVQVDRLP